MAAIAMPAISLRPPKFRTARSAPSLKGYGAARASDAAAVRAVYDKIYDSAVLACSQMPRFGAAKFLSIEQIKDLVAYVVSPDSPVNK